MNKDILKQEVQHYIKAHRQESPASLALKKSPFSEINSSEIAKQIDGWQRSVNKLPTWAFTDNIYYPNKINLEQCSSEHTALIKQTLIPKNARVIDLTGGFGVDTCYIAQEAKQVIHCELDQDLSEIVQYNAQVLKVNNIQCIHGDGIEVLRSLADHSLDVIFIDPSRRNQQQKVFLLKDCIPNILELQDLFFSKAPNIITKLSPLLDISKAILELPHVKMVYVVSLDNDCKELIFIQDRRYHGEPLIRAIRLFRDQLQDFIFRYSEEKSVLNRYKLPQHFLFEPDVSIAKAGAFKSIGKHYDLAKLHQHTHLYTSNLAKLDFPGRIFEIERTIKFSDFKKSYTIVKANIATRNFPMKVDEIRKRFKISDGGDVYLFFTTNVNEELIVIETKKATL